MERILLIAISALILPAIGIAQTKTVKGSLTSKNITVSVERGKIVYMANCLSCHQVNGTGVPRMNPPLTKNKYVMGSKLFIIKQALKGSHGTINIDGDTFNNTMPPFARLTDEQIADVLTYIRNNFSNKASAVKPAEVAAQRKKS